MPRKDKESDKLNNRIGSLIREIRLSFGLSRVELAPKIGVTHQQLHKYESGQNRVTASRLYKIANVLERPVSFFFEEEPMKTKNEPKRLCLEAARNLCKIESLESQKAVAQLIKSLI